MPLSEQPISVWSLHQATTILGCGKCRTYNPPVARARNSVNYFNDGLELDRLILNA